VAGRLLLLTLELILYKLYISEDCERVAGVGAARAAHRTRVASAGHRHHVAKRQLINLSPASASARPYIIWEYQIKLIII